MSAIPELVHEGALLAEVTIEMDQSDAPWSPYVTADEARKLDTVRLALRRDDIETALRYGTVDRVTKVAG